MLKMESMGISILKKCLVFILGIIFMSGITACGNEIPDTIENQTSEVSAEETIETTDEDIQPTLLGDSAIDLSDASLIKEGTLTVGMVIDYPPFEYYPDESESPIGIDVDIVYAVAGELGLAVEIKDVPWDDNLFKNMAVEYDVVCSAVTVTDERQNEMIFSDSYIENHQAVVVNNDFSMNINSFNDLNGLTVAVQKDTVSDELINNLINSHVDDDSFSLTLVEYEVATECFDKLLEGQIDAVVCDSTVAEGQVARNNGILVEAYRDELEAETFAIAISKDNTGLQKAINEALTELQDDGSIKKIISSWFNR